MNEFGNVLSGYRDRVARIALFDVFHQLESKQLKDDEGRPIDFFGIGLLSVLFFFENMLLRNPKTGVAQLATFIKNQTLGTISLTDEGFLHLSKQVIEVFRPQNGKKLQKTFYNYESQSIEVLDYAILKAEHWDPEHNIQYYTLAEEGLELVFATKEYFSEFQISISQMVLRKQLEKGEFVDALRQVDEMRVNVMTIKDKMVRIRHDIQRNIISDETYGRYKELIGDINRRLMSEQDEFNTLMNFIRETKRHMDAAPVVSDKDQKALAYIVRVDNELAHVHFLHSNLLNESIELKSIAIEAAGESLYYTGVASFNFDQEIARKLTMAPLPFETGKALAAPFLGTKKFKTWSLLSLFEAQQILHDEDVVEYAFLEADDEATLKELVEEKQFYKELFSHIATNLNDHHQVSLSQIFKDKQSKVLGSRAFGDLWITLHQQSPIRIKDLLEHEEHVYHEAMKAYFSAYDTLEVLEEGTKEISYDDRFFLKDMVLTLGGHRG